MAQLWKKIAGSNWRDWLRLHHAIDWLIVIALFIAGGLMALLITPHERFLPEDVKSASSYPVKADIIPLYALLIITLALPLVIFGLTQIWHHSRHDFHHATLGVLMAWAVTNFAVTCIKLATGRPRPNYESQTPQGTLGSNDSRSSFPSGHAALAFSSMVFISLYIAGKLKIFKNHDGSVVAKACLVLLPIAIAILIAVSRVIDYHHDFSDIQAGAMLGAGIGAFAYFLWYPSQFSSHCDLPRIHPIIMKEEAEKKAHHESELKDYNQNDSAAHHHHHPTGTKPNDAPIVYAA